MKLMNSILAIVLCAIALTSCSDINDMKKDSGDISGSQVEEANSAIPSRVDASISGMYTIMYQPNSFSSGRVDDLGYASDCLINDFNGSDMAAANSFYNWFTPSSRYDDRMPGYFLCRTHYYIFYTQMRIANEIIGQITPTTSDATLRVNLGQALAVRAFDYLGMAPYYQFRYTTSSDKPCVPIITESTTTSDNPRASVAAVYDRILKDLDAAVVLLKDYSRDDKMHIDRSVAYGLRARAYLAMAKYAEAAASADSAIMFSTASPASIAQVSTPAFCQLSESNWMWGSNLDESLILGSQQATTDSQLSSLSGRSYTAKLSCYRCINSLLYNKIPATDVRKGWWLNADTTSALLDGLTWDDGSGHVAKGRAIPGFIYINKSAMPPYANIKFGKKTGIGSTINTSDYPFMRIEEMILIKAEGLAMSGHEGDAQSLLQSFIQTYRDPQYICKASTAEALQTEIWFQRRVELWGEGFSMFDIMRLGKPVVRFHEGTADNWPDAFRFNVAPDNGWLLLRFPTQETSSNHALPVSADNNDGVKPSPGENGNLRDGVTD